MSLHEHIHQSKAVTDVDGFARRALSIVASQARGDADQMILQPTQAELSLHDSLLAAVTDPDRNLFKRVLSRSIQNGVRVEDIANRHIPAVARALGTAWVEDKLGFSSVSIASARLQNYLIQNGLKWCDAVVHPRAPKASVLLFVPEYEQHTLGATLLAGQLRAENVQVIPKLDATDDDMIRAVERREHDLVMISSSRTETIALLCTTVSKLKNNSACSPVMIGGHLTEEIPDALRTIGADFAANSCQDAMETVRSLTRREDADLIGKMV